MAITLGTFTKMDDGVFTGVIKTLNITANLTMILPGKSIVAYTTFQLADDADGITQE